MGRTREIKCILMSSVIRTFLQILQGSRNKGNERTRHGGDYTYIQNRSSKVQGKKKRFFGHESVLTRLILGLFYTGCTFLFIFPEYGSFIAQKASIC